VLRTHGRIADIGRRDGRRPADIQADAKHDWASHAADLYMQNKPLEEKTDAELQAIVATQDAESAEGSSIGVH
jgi:hypothetical protein